MLPELKVHLPKPSFQADRFMLPLRVRKDMVAERLQAIVLPHRQFANLYHKHPDRWKELICPSQEVLKDFWQAMEHHPLMRSTPLKTKEGGYMSNCIPIRIHGDDVPIVGVGKCWQKMSSVFSWRSLVSIT